MKEWHHFLSEISQELGPEIVKKWVPPLLRFDAGNVYLQASDSFQISWFEEHIRPRLKGLLNYNQRPIKVHLIQEKKAESRQDQVRSLSFSPDPIDPEMALEHFIPNSSNLVACKLLSENSPFNPIYLYGNKGVGKTHLLMGAALKLEKSGRRVFFAKAETFTEHVVQAIRLGQMQEFRKVYREIDALIIDDIHIFSKKTATQEEFFHTFNTLHTLGLFILISANVPPGQLQEIEPRLVSRFEWGISLEIGKGDTSAILKHKASLWHFPINEELCIWLSETFQQDPVLALQALVLRSKGSCRSVSSAEKLLEDLVKKEQEDALTAEKIVKQVAAHYGIMVADILGKSQMRTAALPRQIAMYLCRERLKLPFQTIGKFFDRDHSTVMSSIKQIQKGIEERKYDLPETLLR